MCAATATATASQRAALAEALARSAQATEFNRGAPSTDKPIDSRLLSKAAVLLLYGCRRGRREIEAEAAAGR